MLASLKILRIFFCKIKCKLNNPTLFYVLLVFTLIQRLIKAINGFGLSYVNVRQTYLIWVGLFAGLQTEVGRNCFTKIVRIELKLRCDERFTHAFTACGCVFKEITLVSSNQDNYFENATACSKRTLKTTVATQLKVHFI